MRIACFNKCSGTLLVIIILLLSQIANAADESAVKAAFIEKLTRFIEWPAESAINPESPFVLCVIGKDTLDGALDKLANITQVKGRSLDVHYLDDVKAINGCHSLFISTSMSKRLPVVLDRVKSRPILTIGDTEGYASQGVMVNFYQEQGRLRFEVNRKAASSAGIRMGSRVLKLARIVDDEV